MSTPDATARPASDRWRFLERPAERLRYAVIGSLIRSLAGKGQVTEIGSGGGHLLRWLDAAQTTAYTAVDIDADLLSGLHHDRISITRHPIPMEEFVPPANPIAALVVSEVLYYVEDPGSHLMRIWQNAGEVELALISSILPKPDKPNWQRGYDRVTAAITTTGWRIIDRIRIESATERLAWEIVALRPGRAPVSPREPTSA